MLPSMHHHPDWIIPDWPAPAGVRAVFTTRAGGVSRAPYDSLNLGAHVGDSAGAVLANRARLRSAIGVQPVFLDQVHGSRTLVIDAQTDDGQAADACVTARRKTACTIMVADCLPVLLTTETGDVVAAAHAGWRGLCGIGGSGDSGGQGVLESVYASFCALEQAGRATTAIKTIAWLGPCIGPKEFEVGAEVRAAFVAAQPEAASCFADAEKGRFLADLPALARLRLRALGVERIHGNDGSPPWCTVSHPSRFFSHRRDVAIKGATGRMAACVWLD